MEVLFEGQVRVRDEECTLVLTQTQAEWTYKGKKYAYLYSNVLGAVSNTQSSAFSILIYGFAGPKEGEREFRVGTKQRISFKADQVQVWVAHIQSLILDGHLSPSPDVSIPRKRFLVLVNPASGKGQAVVKWNTAHPLFEACTLTVICTPYTATTHRGHAEEIVTGTDWALFDGVVVVSGDGLMHEVVNALCKMGRVEVPVAALPGGSSNAMACVLCENSGLPCTLFNSAYVTIKGKSAKLDITRINRENEPPIYSFLSVSWGFIADTDIGSDTLRWLGSLRFNLYGLWRLMRLRRYSGTLTMWEDSGEVTESGGFLSFISCNLPFIGVGMHVAPRAALNDGFNDLLFVRSEHTGRFGLARVLLRQDSGRHLDLQQLHYVKARRWRLVPNVPEGIFSIDGEMYPAGPIEAEVVPGLALTLAL